jgi:large subunit ribosomal protein L3
LWEFRVNSLDEFKVGSELTVNLFESIMLVDVVAVSKGKGFAGVIKRHNFSTQDASHGNSLSHRVGGSIGQRQSPGKVFKGKKMAGQMGNKQVTVPNLNLVKVDVEKGLLLISGGVPGAPGTYVVIYPAKGEKK